MKKIKATKPDMSADRSISLSASITKAEPKSDGGSLSAGNSTPAVISPLKLIKAEKAGGSNKAVQHVSKHFDIVLAVDFHWTTIPIPPSFGIIPLPLPHPFLGMVFDPMDYLRFNIPVPAFAQGLIGMPSIPMGGSVFVHGRHKATTTTTVMGVLLPFRHITSLPVYFIVNIAGSPHEGEVYWGSTTVKAQGSELSGSNPGQVLTCWCPPMGLKPLPTVPAKLKKNPLAYFAFYSDLLSMYVQINTGKPVLVGAEFKPHQYTLKEYVMRFAAIGLMRGLTKIGGKLLTGLNHILQNMFGGKFKNNPLSKLLCFYGLEPVNFVTGAMFFEWTDFELPGGHTLQWNNVWRSDKPYAGMMGNQVYNNYDLYIYPDAEAGVAGFSHPSENMVMPMPYIEPYSGRQYDRTQKIWMERPDEQTWILTINQDIYTYKVFKGADYGEIYRVDHIAYTNGSSLSFQYRNGLLSAITDDSGRKLEMEHTENGAAIAAVFYKYKNTNQLMVRYAYDEQGNMIRVYDQADQSINFDYDENNRVIKRINRNGMQYFWRYDSLGRVIHTEGQDGFMSGTLRYFPEEGYNEVHYRSGKTERYFYDEDDLVYKKTDAMGGETWYEYNRYNERKMIASPEGRVIGYEYDEMGNITTYHTPDGEAYTYQYDVQHNLILRSDPAGMTEKWTYNEQNQLLRHVQKDGRILEFFYVEGRQLPVSCKDDSGLEIFWTYNRQHQLIEAVTSDGNSRRWEYDDYGRLIRFSPDGYKTTTWERDDMGRVTAVKEFGEEALKFRYDAYDLPVYASDGNEEWRMDYTPMGSLKTQTRSSRLSGETAQTLHFTYDKWENLKGITNEKGEIYSFLRDANDDVIQENGFDGQEQRYVRNRDGQVIKTLQPDGKAVYHNYDLAGRLVYSKYEDDTYQAFQYDKLGLLIAAENELSSVNYSRNPLGMVTQEIQDGHSISYQYDVFGNLVNLKSSLGAVVDYQYDAMGYLSNMAAKCEGGPEWTAGISRNKKGQEVLRSLSGGVTATFDYDHEGHPISQKVEAAKSITSYKQYGWGPNDKLNTCLNSITGGKVNYRYDTFGSLSSATYSHDGKVVYKNPDATGDLYKTANRSDRRYDKGGKLLKDDQWYYRYDAHGNLVQKSKRNINGLERSVVTEPAGSSLFEKKLNWGIVDPNNPVADQITGLTDAPPGLPEWQIGDWAYAWTAGGMMKAVKNPKGEVIHFEYDALGRRRAKIVGEKIYRYVWDGNLLLHEWNYPLAERPNLVVNEDGLLNYDKDEPLGEELITWVYDQNIFTPSAKLVNGERYSIVSDYLGTPVQAFDDTGKKVWDCELDIFGKIRKLTGDKGFIPFRYQGQYEDQETGLYYNRFRYYDAEIGKYISKDPIGLNGGLALYGYVHDTNGWLDVFGLAGTGGAYLFGFENGDKYIGKGEIGRMDQSIKVRKVQTGNSPLIGKAHVSTNGNNELGKMVEYKVMKDAQFTKGAGGVPSGYLNSYMSGETAWNDNPHLHQQATDLADKLKADYEADVKTRAEVSYH